MTNNPYEPPMSPVEESENGPSDPFAGVFERMLARSRGARWELGGMSFVLWLPVLFTGRRVFSLDVDEPYTLIIQGLFVVCAVVLTRVISILQTSTYLHHARGDSARPWNLMLSLRSSLYLVIPTLVGIVFASIATIGLGFGGVQRSWMTSAIRIWAFLMPFMFVAPTLWAAAPFWLDGEDLSDGMRAGKALLSQAKGKAWNLIALSYLLAAMAALFPPLVVLFDPISKGGFTEAYLRMRDNSDKTPG